MVDFYRKEPPAKKRYMVLDGPVKCDDPDSKPVVQMLAKKKSVEAPAKILMAGAEHLKTLQQSGNNKSKQSQTSPSDFYFELLRLRQNWRLKKVSNTILGDLSYRTAGSQFKQSGIFEVVKSDEALAADKEAAMATAAGVISSSSNNSSSQQSNNNNNNNNGGKSAKSALKVNVPSELEGIAYIQVTIQKESEHMVTASLSNFSPGFGSSPPDLHWQKKLEAAQNVLFCKELFSQLAREAIQLQAPIPHMVVGNQITASLFSDIQLIISLCHSTGNERKSAHNNHHHHHHHHSNAANNQSNVQDHHHHPSSSIHHSTSSSSSSTANSAAAAASSSTPQSQRDHSHVLEHSLHQLLRQQHSRNINPDHVALSSAPVGVSKKRRFAGPRAADRSALLDMANHQTLLEQVIQQAQHVVLRLRTMFVLDTMARDLKDPLITCHWSTLSSPTRTSVKVSIVTAGYDTILRTQLVIHVGEKHLTVICKEKGRVLHFSHEPQELRDFILSQISQHQINGCLALAKICKWRVSASSNSLGVGPVEPVGNATACILSNPGGNRSVAVRHSPQGNATVYVADSEDGQFKEVRLDKLDGKNLLGKLELLMASST